MSGKCPIKLRQRFDRTVGVYWTLNHNSYVFIFLVKVTEWPPIGKIAAHLAYRICFHGISTWAQNYNASLNLRPTLAKVTNFDSIFYS